MIKILAVTLIACASFVSAQLDVGSISAGCAAALNSVVANPEASACLSPNSFVPILSAQNASIIAPIDSWLTTICAAGPCSNATLSAIITNVTTGCPSELDVAGATSTEIAASIISTVQQYYPVVRKIVCLKDGSANCITKTLTSIESFVGGSLSVSKVLQLVISSGPNAQSIPSNITCTNCVKAAYNVLAQDIPSLVSDVAPSAQSQCGASFTDGKTPDDITQSAADLAAPLPSGSSAALGSVSLLTRGAFTGIIVSAFVAASTAFAFLA
ncbi:hypothetical protein Hypma_007785 [Hypsizygus marmoreus]|uniref:Uncharacterized protein n=1 Tax=Hypsizygus marmoreus TaxID=39966 RepID=A0A369JXE2_HYPMA|nr:hypothetical protein Hypma_007785 [Hypsizygus marmoreus]